MSNGIRHVARHRATGSRLVIAFLQIPDAPDKTLTIPVDSLPPYLEQKVMEILQSPEGQQTENFGEVLSRRMMPDIQMTILSALHQKGYLIPQAVGDVEMTPFPNQAHNLEKVLMAMGRLQVQPTPTSNSMTDIVSQYAQQQQQSPMINESADNFYGTPPQPAPVPPPYTPMPYDGDRGNTFGVNQQIDATAQQIGIARNLLIEAEMLQDEANRKRDQAYKIAPQLVPVEPTYSPPPQPIQTPVTETIAVSEAPKTKRKSTGVTAPKRPTKSTAAKKAGA